MIWNNQEGKFMAGDKAFLYNKLYIYEPFCNIYLNHITSKKSFQPIFRKRITSKSRKVKDKNDLIYQNITI